MEYRYQVVDTVRVVRVERVERDGDAYRVSIDGGEDVAVRMADMEGSTLELDLYGSRRRVHVVRDGGRRLAAVGSDVFEFALAERSGSRRAQAAGGAGDLTAQMPGQVVAVHVAEGDMVTHGQTLVVLEAMKMEMRVVAPRAGTVQKVLVSVGQVVERGQVLVELD
ncbi:MAG: biotin/lipoyl-binding protein [Chloroflexi bacterium]|nr:biotin/lipoyl-binding protein [Chloroflexota bacterium]